MEKEFCEKVSEVSGACVRKTEPVCRCIRKTGELIKKGAGSVVYSAKRLVAKLGNLSKSISSGSTYASIDESQKKVFLKLGKEVFYKTEKGNSKVFSTAYVKELIEEARDYEADKMKIKDGSSKQKLKMDELVIFRRATCDLTNSNPGIRRVAVRVLKRLGNRDAVPYLTGCLEDPDPMVRKHAQEALHVLINEDPETNGGGKK